MNQKDIKKVVIVGCAGSGKTTLALELNKKLQIPIYHLDQYHWLPNWQRIEPKEFLQKHNELCAQDRWIIEGVYVKQFAFRAQHADLIIFLNIPRYLCFWRVFKRALINHSKTIEGDPKGCKQSLFKFNFWQFLRWIWNFNKNYHAMIMDVLIKYQDSKQIFILQSNKDIQSFLRNL